MKLTAVILLLAVAGFAVFFRMLDSGLSGGSATNAIVPIGIAVICIGMAIMVVLGNEELAKVVAKLAALAPLLVLAYCATVSRQYDQSPAKKDDKELAGNIRCAARAAVVPEADKGFVRARINILGDHGDVNGQLQREIEQRLRIIVLPDCRFNRVSAGQ